MLAVVVLNFCLLLLTLCCCLPFAVVVVYLLLLLFTFCCCCLPFAVVVYLLLLFIFCCCCSPSVVVVVVHLLFVVLLFTFCLLLSGTVAMNPKVDHSTILEFMVPDFNVQSHIMYPQNEKVGQKGGPRLHVPVLCCQQINK